MTDRVGKKRIEFSPVFNKKITAVPLEIKIAFQEAFEIFAEDPQNEMLRNHILTGKYSGVRSINVTDDWRALYREERERIIFIVLGTHEQLYGM